MNKNVDLCVSPYKQLEQVGARRTPSLSAFCSKLVLTLRGDCPQKTYCHRPCPKHAAHTHSVRLQNAFCCILYSIN